jgi:hypothetical protein
MSEIRSTTELLEGLIAKERERLAELKLPPHAPTIGLVYEGALRHQILPEILFRPVLEDFDLRVVTGFIRNAEDEWSRQIDVMIVEGEGERLDGTDIYVYPPDQVIATIEVKKVLNASGLEDGFVNAKSVSEVIKPATDWTEPRRSRFATAFRGVTGRLVEDCDASGFELQWTGSALLRDAQLPLRIVLGYEGYRTEAGLRKGTIAHLAGLAQHANQPGPGRAPHRFPNLVLGERTALVKLNGLPYSGPLDAEWGWPLFASSEGMNAVIFLEVLWSRLASHFGLGAEIFGDDLDLELMHPLLYARPVEVGGNRAWAYRPVEGSLPPTGSDGRNQARWEPIEVDALTASLLERLAAAGPLSDTDPWVVKLAKQEHAVPGDLLDRVVTSHLAFKGLDGRVRLFSDRIGIAELGDGRLVAGDDATRRFSRWLANHAKDIGGVILAVN